MQPRSRTRLRAAHGFGMDVAPPPSAPVEPEPNIDDPPAVLVCAPGTFFNIDTSTCEPGTPSPAPAPLRAPPSPTQPTQQASMITGRNGGLSGMLPWLLGGAAVVAAVLIVRSAGEG